MKKFNADRVVSVSAIIVSLATLIMILYQTNLMREEQKASVMPILSIGYSISETDEEVTEKIWLSNRGLGPAFIEDFKILVNGEEYRMDPYGYLSSQNFDNNTKTLNRLYEGQIIPANDGMVFYEKAVDSTTQHLLGNIFKYSYETVVVSSDEEEKAIIEIIYKSIYDDYWMIRSDKTTPIAID